MNFSGKVYAVTGGGSGIGEAVVTRLAAEGASVVVVDFDTAAGERVVGAVQSAGGNAAFIHADVSKEDDVQAFVDFAAATYGRLDGAVNNAGIGHPRVRLDEISMADWDRVHVVNLRGVFLCMRAQLKHFLSTGGGVIVNTTSAAGLHAVPLVGAYTAAKHGVVGLTRQASIEYVKDNIRVNAVAPGLVSSQGFQALPDEIKEPLLAVQPGGRAAEPSEIANAIVWLLSPESSFVSGDTLVVDAAGLQR